jgi:hypothetical protein
MGWAHYQPIEFWDGSAWASIPPELRRELDGSIHFAITEVIWDAHADWMKLFIPEDDNAPTAE